LSAVSSGSLFIIYKVYSKFENPPTQLCFALFLTTVYYGIIAYTLESRISKLYITILKNEDLIGQNKKVIQAFPHGVIIDSMHTNDSKVCFSNDEFNSKIRNIRNRVTELANVEVTLKDDSSTGQAQELKTDLQQYLSHRQQLLQDSKDTVLEQMGVRIK